MELSIAQLAPLNSEAVAPASRSHHLAGEAPAFQLTHSLNGLDRLQSAWNALAQSSVSGPFQSFSWNRGWYRHFAHAYDEMLVFSLQRDGKTIGIAPLYQKGRRLRFAADGVGDHQDFLAADSASAAELLREILNWARRNGTYLELSQVREQAWVAGAMRGLHLWKDGTFHYQRCYSACPVLEMPESLDAFLKSLPRKTRGNFKRHLNKTAREYPDAKLEVHRAGEIAPELVEEVAHFHAAHFRKDGVSLLAAPDFVALIQSASHDPNSGLRLATLRNGEELMAIDIGFTLNGTYHGFLTTFDPKYRQISPGNVLLLRRIDWLVRHDGIRTIDFLLGNERYKSEFTDRSYQVCAHTVYPAGLLNLGRLAAKRIYFGSKYLAKWLLQKSGVAKYSV